MRFQVWFPLLLAIAVPVTAWSGPLDSPRPAPMGPAPMGPVPMRPILGRAAETADPATLCETAITSAEYVGRLPPRLLAAIGLTETGRVDPATGRIRPWAWTINAAGEGQFFESRQQAIVAVKALQARGVQSIDVGCLQVNLMYHPAAFATLEDAFDPRTNAAYAARFLNALYVEGRDWEHAIAAYHSETPALGDAYRVLVMARWQNGDLHPVPPSPTTAYGDFVRRDVAYGAFAPSSRVYGAFAMPASGR
jgi:hypothetical protein